MATKSPLADFFIGKFVNGKVFMDWVKLDFVDCSVYIFHTLKEEIGKFLLFL